MALGTPYRLPPGVRIGHVHLAVADLARAEAFYCDVLGFTVMLRWPGAIFISEGSYHHLIGLNTWETAGAPPPPPGHTGLYHLAILFPDRPSLAGCLTRVRAAGVELEGASDHGVSEAIYLRDPDGNGIELYRDRPPAEWPRRENGELVMFTRRLDLDALLAEAP